LRSGRRKERSVTREDLNVLVRDVADADTSRAIDGDAAETRQAPGAGAAHQPVREEVEIGRQLVDLAGDRLAPLLRREPYARVHVAVWAYGDPARAPGVLIGEKFRAHARGKLPIGTKLHNRAAG